MHNFKNLDCWKEAMILCQEIYSITKNFPSEEKYGLTSQMRRASVSIASNISEGSARSTDKDFCHFLDMALGSSFELETQAILSKNLGYVKEGDEMALSERIAKVQRIIIGFKKFFKE